MRFASLFTGAGGLDLGLHQAGHEALLLCESDEGAQQVLKHAFPGVLLVPDVCGLAELPQGTELLVAGFPCIDISRAGCRQGLTGQSSGLVKHVFRLLQRAQEAARPVPWVLLENVDALLNGVDGAAPPVAWIASQLEALGYGSWAHRIVNTAGFGLPNRRRRVFLVASMHGDARDVLLAQGIGGCCGACKLLHNGRACYLCHDPPSEECSFALDLGNAQSAPPVDVVPTFKTTNGRLLLLLSRGEVGMLRIQDAERLQGMPEGYTEPCYPVRRPGINYHRQAPLSASDIEKRDAFRFKLLGNAVSVPVAHWLGQRLAAPYHAKYVVGAKDTPYEAAAAPDPSMPEVGQPGRPWPRAAWFVRGLGRHAAAAVSEAPVLQPLTPLGEFIKQVGPVPDKEALAVYLRRMREHGWDVSPTIRKALQCGASIMPEARQVQHLHHAHKHADSIGDLVWGRIAPNVWWPGEALNPLQLPPGRSLPPGATSALSVQQMCVSLPAPRDACEPSTPSKAHEELAPGPVTRRHREVQCLMGEESEQPLDLTQERQSRHGRGLSADRRVLVIFLGASRFMMWHRPSELQPLSAGKEAKVQQARVLHDAKKLGRPFSHFQTALEEAQGLAQLKQSLGEEAPAADSAALMALAAAKAAEANTQLRCGQCCACSGILGSTQRCLVMRASAAAAAGKLGGQLAVLGQDCVGARIQVWWPLDSAFYTGVITAFHPLEHKHTVAYEDGDIEHIQLWAPDQEVRVMSERQTWTAETAELALQRALQLRADQRATQMEAQQAAEGAEAAVQQTPQELERQARMAAQSQMLQELGFGPASPAATRPPTRRTSSAAVPVRSVSAAVPPRDLPAAVVEPLPQLDGLAQHAGSPSPDHADPEVQVPAQNAHILTEPPLPAKDTSPTDLADVSLSPAAAEGLPSADSQPGLLTGFRRSIRQLCRSRAAVAKAESLPVVEAGQVSRTRVCPKRVRYSP